MVKIFNGSKSKIEQFCWIGDASAVNAEVKRKITQEDSVQDHLESIIKDPNVPGVDGLAIAVSYSNGSFNYLHKFFGHNPNPKISSTGLVQLIGTREQGSYSYSFFSSTGSVPCLGVFFHPGNVGYLYRPLEDRPIVTIKDVSQNDFIDKVKEDYEIEISGIQAN